MFSFPIPSFLWTLPNLHSLSPQFLVCYWGMSNFSSDHTLPLLLPSSSRRFLNFVFLQLCTLQAKFRTEIPIYWHLLCLVFINYPFKFRGVRGKRNFGEKLSVAVSDLTSEVGRVFCWAVSSEELLQYPLFTKFPSKDYWSPLFLHFWEVA